MGEWPHGSTGPRLLRKHAPESGPQLRELELGRRSSGRDAWRVGRQSEVREELAHDNAVGEERNQLAQSAAMPGGAECLPTVVLVALTGSPEGVETAIGILCAAADANGS